MKRKDTAAQSGNARLKLAMSLEDKVLGGVAEETGMAPRHVQPRLMTWRKPDFVSHIGEGDETFQIVEAIVPAAKDAQGEIDLRGGLLPQALVRHSNVSRAQRSGSLRTWPGINLLGLRWSVSFARISSG
ncbi:hypothetical protein GCM10007276_11100 [Agaricicola taiwanensis]|uniref:Uncharacterized protein n=1 Tax=Agaricicola taiwanensis TaxID=591372 RepID=A0A8J2YGI2_9RHOB|nr:hypothetical protein GCM10007276_11100 [Agaricicola taiwanensis]